MKRRFDDYTRLARGLFGVSSLWLGPTHLLSVRGTGVLVPFVQAYRRYELDRIQAVSVVRTRTGLVLNLVYGALVLGFGGVGGAAWWQAVAVGGRFQELLYAVAVPSLLVGGLGLVLLVINCALGPTCHFQLHTATRIERLRPLRRLRAARRVLAQLTPVLLAAQSGQPPSVTGGR
jgi:hypothetical protein